MSTLYGDNIFESKDINIDRLFESIENDIALFENYDIINEGFVDAIKNLIGKIRDLLKAAINWIKSIPSKIKEFFDSKRKKTVETKIEDTNKNIDNLKKLNDELDNEAKLLEFDEKLRNMAKSFNSNMNISAKDKYDTELRVIKDKNKFINYSSKYDDLISKIESALTNRDEFKDIQQNIYMTSAFNSAVKSADLGD
jgi:cell shape-determining protein MreC